ncbi:MAG: hypothetical protein AB7S26_27815 [Sandaracinaceae bacterium]
MIRVSQASLLAVGVVVATGCDVVVGVRPFDEYCLLDPGVEMGECSLVRQCGCAAGETCGLLMDVPSCGPSGASPVNGSCVHSDGCAAGTVCVGPADAVNGHCVPHCSSDADCASVGPHSECNPSMSLPDAVGYCTVECVPGTADVCQGDVACSGFGPHTSCLQLGDGAVDDPCGAGLRCQRDLRCMLVPSLSELRCRPSCGPGFAACPAGEACYFIQEEPPSLEQAGRDEWGACIPPP